MELKTLLVNTFGPSEDQLAKLFLSITDLGEQLLSKVMEDVLHLHNDEIPTISSVSSINISPGPVRHALAACKTEDPQAFAQELDHLIVDFMDRLPFVALTGKFPHLNVPH